MKPFSCWAAQWRRFWFAAADPLALHVVRLAVGLTVLLALLPLAGHVEAFFGLTGWFDTTAFREYGMLPATAGTRPLGWSVLYVFGTDPAMLKAVYWVMMVGTALFTAGVAPRLTSIVTWLTAASFTDNPAMIVDADALLTFLTLYLVIGYSTFAPWLAWPLRREDDAPTSASNLALRLMQVHFAVAVVASVFHKMQMGQWWSGTAYWFILNAPGPDTVKQIREAGAGIDTALRWCGLMSYAVMAWQLAFPAFAWRRGWRPVLLAGGLIGMIGSAWLFNAVDFGCAFLAGCLAFVTSSEWRAVGERLGFAGFRRAATAALLLLAITAAACAPTGVPTAASGQVEVHKPPEGSEPLPPPTDIRVNAGLKVRVKMAIDHVRRRDLEVSNGFWTVFHGILGLGPSTQLLDRAKNQRVNALEYIRTTGGLRGLYFVPTNGGVDVLMRPDEIGVAQGHQDQYIAEMAQWNLPIDTPFHILGNQYTFRDFVNKAKTRARTDAHQELSWAVLVIPHYDGTSATWQNDAGQRLSVEDLVRYELDQSVEGAACGGTHRLFGLSWAWHLHAKSGGKPEGVWAEVIAKTHAYRDNAKHHRNSDSSLSTNYFTGPGNDGDHNQRISSTGHMLEWLALALSDEELAEPWVEDAANALSLMILDAGTVPIDGGALYHAVHGLIIYYARRFDGTDLGPLNPPIPWPPGSRGFVLAPTPAPKKLEIPSFAPPK